MILRNLVILSLLAFSTSLLGVACGNSEPACGLSITLEGHNNDGESFFECAGGQGSGSSLSMGFRDDSSGISVLIESDGPSRGVVDQDYPATITVEGPDYESKFSCSIHVGENQDTEAHINEVTYSISGIGRCGRSVNILASQEPSPYRVIGEFSYVSSVDWRSGAW